MLGWEQEEAHTYIIPQQNLAAELKFIYHFGGHPEHGVSRATSALMVCLVNYLVDYSLVVCVCLDDKEDDGICRQIVGAIYVSLFV